MRIILVKQVWHHKNLNFIMKCKQIDFVMIDSVNEIDRFNLEDFDAIMSPSEPIHVKKYPDTTFIFGPHFNVYPDDRLEEIKGPNSFFNLLNKWVIHFWERYPICNGLKLIALPFGVDTMTFINTKPISERNKVMIYFKHRDPSDLNFVKDFLQMKRIQEYSIFSYDARYDESDYLQSLQDTKYAIWIDAHESQGFAYQEALSCDVPLLVWNIRYMSQEYGFNYPDIEATTTSYWNDQCGEIFYEKHELENTFQKLICNLEHYKPREFILNHLSISVCEKRWMDFIERINCHKDIFSAS